MTTMLELRQNVINLYRNYENITRMAAKFLLVFIAMLCMNARIGFDDTVTSPVFALLIGLVGALIPMNLTVAIMGLVMILHLYSLGLEAAGVGALLFLVLLLLYMRFDPKDAWLILLVPVCSFLKIPYVIPVIAGLLLGTGLCRSGRMRRHCDLFPAFYSRKFQCIGNNRGSGSAEQDPLCGGTVS